MREVEVLRASTESAGGMGDNNNDRDPVKPHKPLDHTEEHTQSPDRAHQPVCNQFNQGGELTGWQEQAKSK